MLFDLFLIATILSVEGQICIGWLAGQELFFQMTHIVQNNLLFLELVQHVLTQLSLGGL